MLKKANKYTKVRLHRPLKNVVDASSHNNRSILDTDLRLGANGWNNYSHKKRKIVWKNRPNRPFFLQNLSCEDS